MAIKLHSKKALTIVELVIAMVLFVIILLVVSFVIVSQFQYAASFNAESMLKGESIYIIERLKKAVTNSEHVDIAVDENGTSLKLYNRDSRVVPTGTFTLGLDGVTLTYTPFGGTSEIISNKVSALTFDDEQDPGKGHSSPIYVLRVGLKVWDPKDPSAQGASVITAIACRLTARRLAVFNVRLNKTYYTIGEALIDSEFADNDVLRCMGRVSGYFDGIFDENVVITKSVTLKGSYDKDFSDQGSCTTTPPITPTTIDGMQKGSVITCNTNGIDVTIDSFVITNGKATQSAPLRGGGICSLPTIGCTLTITNNKIQNNFAGYAGGGIGIHFPGNNNTLIIAKNTITKNSAGLSLPGGTGGGMYLQVWKDNNTTAIYNNVLTGNWAQDSGGGMFVANNGNLSTCIIANNTIGGPSLADQNSTSGGGGGLFFASGSIGAPSSAIIANNISIGNAAQSGAGMSVQANSAASVINNVITKNYAVQNSGAGAGLYVLTKGGTSTVSNNTITENVASKNGCGMFASSDFSSNLIVTKNTITGNHAPEGNIICASGGIYAYIYTAAVNATISITNNKIAGNTVPTYAGGISTYGQDGDTIRITNNTIAGNSAGTIGGGIRTISQIGCTTYIDHNTIVGNSASNGGGINSTSLTVDSITNSICHGNLPDNIFRSGTIDPSVSYSDVGGGIYPGPYNIDQPPAYEDAATGDYHLKPPPDNAGIIGGGNDLTEMGAYGGSDGVIGFVMPASDDLNTQYIREDKIGTFEI